MKIGIIGTRGIPNEYGGFEQFAEYFSVFATEAGHDVTVYCSSLHSYQQQTFKGVKLVHAYDPENKIGTAGQFIYDLNCILHSRKQNFDVILQLGYTSSSIWNFLFKEKVFVATNMDGMEWKRTKYNKLTQQFLKFAEGWAVKRSNLLIADSNAIADYLIRKYKKTPIHIAYGATIFNNTNASLLKAYQLKPKGYYLVIARMEPENNIETIIKGYIESGKEIPLIIVGNTTNKYGKKLLQHYNSDRVRFIQGIYNEEVLNNLRHYALCYFHGHSVGGTNPSLLEAMAAGVFIAAHDNEFNKSVLHHNALYFSSPSEVATIINNQPPHTEKEISANIESIRTNYAWPKINQTLLDQLIIRSHV